MFISCVSLTQQIKTNTMKSFKVLQSLMTEANRNMVKFIKSGDDKKAIMWAERLEELEKEIELI